MSSGSTALVEEGVEKEGIAGKHWRIGERPHLNLPEKSALTGCNLSVGVRNVKPRRHNTMSRKEEQEQ